MTRTLVAKQLFVRLLVSSVAIVGAVAFYLLALLPAVQWIFSTDDPATGALRRTGVLVTVVLAYWATVRFYEKRRAHELRLAPRWVLAGALSGAALVGAASLLLFAIGSYEVVEHRGLQDGLLRVAWTIVIAATIEEIAFRAILFQALESAFGTVPALWLQSLVFSVLHIANLNDQMGAADMVMTVVSGTLLGALWTLVFVLSRNVWVATANHAAWNFMIVLTGLPLSGLDDWLGVAPLVSTYQGPNWLTGGAVGPEDSIITVTLVAAAVIAMVVYARKSKKFRGATK